MLWTSGDAKWAPNFKTKVSKQLIDLTSKRVNQLRVALFNEVGKTLQKTLSSNVYNPICVTYMSMCSSGLVTHCTCLRQVPSNWQEV